jgi:hypothetical protein
MGQAVGLKYIWQWPVKGAVSFEGTYGPFFYL